MVLSVCTQWAQRIDTYAASNIAGSVSGLQASEGPILAAQATPSALLEFQIGGACADPCVH